jgi:transposase
MITEDEREQIRRAYFLDHHSARQIARDLHRSGRTITKVLFPELSPATAPRRPRSAPVFGPFEARVEALLMQNERLPRKQRFTAHKIFEILRDEGYRGCESLIRAFKAAWQRERQAIDTFLPLEFEPGRDAQVDWGEAHATIGGIEQTVQLFVMRLCYSRRLFVMAFPSAKQECFFAGHVQAFAHFGGVPLRISYDNLASAVKISFDHGRTRRENRTFVSFRSHYLFESHFCTPGEGHEKGGVENAVGYARRNFLVPPPEMASFDALNLHLLQACLREDLRRVARTHPTIGEAWEEERPALIPLPPFAYDCCTVTTAQLTPYSQATFESNRYSVPVQRARREVTVKAYPFHVDLLDATTLLARHSRCYEREQDIFDPLHYLALLEQRPGAFDYAKPLQAWRRGWPASYHLMLRTLRDRWPEGRGVQEFVRILRLHQDHPAPLVQSAIEQALTYGCVHLDGVLHCLHQLTQDPLPDALAPPAASVSVHEVGTQPIDLARYELLLQRRS